MLTPTDLVDRLEELVRDAFPGEEVHRDLAPEGFVRPCNLIELESCKGAVEYGTQIVELRPVIKITTFTEVDEYHHSHLAALHLRQMRLTGLLLPGYLKVGDRAPKVRELTLDGGFDYDEVRAVFSYTLSRADFETARQVPEMLELHLKQEVKTYG